MARASLTSPVKGTYHSSYGENAHERLTIAPEVEHTYDPTHLGNVDEDNEQASFERMMRTNRAAGL